MSWPTEEQHAAAVKAFLTTAGVNPYDLDEIPSTRPAKYTEVHVMPKVGGAARLGSSTGVRAVRLTLMVIASTVTDARVMLSKVDGLNDARLNVAGWPVTPRLDEAASSVAPRYDDKAQRYFASRAFTYSI